MNILIWTFQAFISIVFLYSGICKASQSKEWLINKGQTGVAGFSMFWIRFIGFIELAGVLGLFLPWFTKVFPLLTPISSMGLGLIMMPAAVIHSKRGEYKSVILNIFIFLLCLLIAWVRFEKL